MSAIEAVEFLDYDFNGVFQLKFQKGLSQLTHDKLEHWRTNVSTPELVIKRRNEREIGMDPLSLDCHVRGGGTHVAIGNRLIADEVIAENGRYRLVDGPSVFDVSPGVIECSGLVSDAYFEHNVLRPVINNITIPKGLFLAHAGGAALDDNIIVFIGETGKTSVLIELLTRGGDYIANESLFLGRGGQTTLYSTWLGLEERHFELFPELNAALFSKPSDRRRLERKISFQRMGASMTGGGFVSKTLREFLMSRHQFSLLCSYKNMFPNAGLLESGRASHIFLLNGGESDKLIERSDPVEIARIATASSWITAGSSHCALAELAGMDTYTKQDLNDVLLDACDKSECHIINLGQRSTRTRESLKKVVDAMVSVVK